MCVSVCVYLSIYLTVCLSIDLYISTSASTYISTYTAKRGTALEEKEKTLRAQISHNKHNPSKDNVSANPASSRSCGMCCSCDSSHDVLRHKKQKPLPASDPPLLLLPFSSSSSFSPPPPPHPSPLLLLLTCFRPCAYSLSHL